MVGFECNDQMVSCKDYLKERGYETTWIDHAARAASIALADENITAVRASARGVRRPAACRQIGHNGGVTRLPKDIDSCN
eukprot:14415470-Heterocapsa_arctica.AAC.1